MKILFCSHYYTPEGNAPAARTSAHAKRWAAKGHEVRVITGVPNVPDGKVYDGYRNRIWPQREIVDGVEVRRVWTFIAANKGNLLRIFNYVSYLISATLLACFSRRPDVFMATSPQFFCGWTIVLMRCIYRLRDPFNRRSVTFVLEIRDIWPESIGAVGAMKKGSMFRAIEGMERIMYRSADHIVTVGEGYRIKLEERSVPAKMLSVIMNGVDRDVYEAAPPDPASVRKRWGLGDRFVCAYIGTIGMASGLSVVVRAAERLAADGNQEIVFLIVGGGAIRDELESTVAEKGLSNVIFTGRQPRGEMRDFLAATDVCLIHLRRQPLFETVIPSKIFEAAGMKRPILIGVDGFARKLVKQIGGGLAFEPENESEMLQKLIQLQSDPELCRRLGEKGGDYVKKHFNRDDLAMEYLQLLEMLNRRKSSPVKTETGKIES